MKKIIFFINTLGMGGAEHVLVDIVNNLDPKKFDITIKTIYDNDFYLEELNSNVKVETFYKTNKNKFIDKLIRKFIYYIIKYLNGVILYKIFVKQKYDIEVAFLEGIPTKIISNSNNKKSKKVSWVHCDFEVNFDSDSYFKNMNQQINCYKNFDQIYCVSKKSKEAFCNRFNIKEDVFVVYNIVDVKKIRANAEQECKLSENKINLITVGRLNYQKGYVRLIEAINKVSKKAKNSFHLYIVGEGEEREKIEEVIKNNKLQKYVTLLGRQKNPYKYIKNSDIYICSSYSEGAPLTILESIALNIPILATDCSDFKNLIQKNKIGFVVNNNLEDLVLGLEKILNNKNIIQGYKKNINDDIILNFASVKVVENFLLEEK